MKTQTPQGETGAQFSALAKAIDCAWLQTQNGDFTEGLREYRRVEAEFVARMNDNESFVLETRRRIAEAILSLAYDKHPPFEVCREAWNEVVRLGFTNLGVRCRASSDYVLCCLYDEECEEGLAVLEPLLDELERGLEEAKAAQRRTGFHEQELEGLGDLRDELLLQQRGQRIPDRRTRRMDEADAPTPEEERSEALYDEFSNACHAVFRTFARTRDRNFSDVAVDYRRIEAEFTARVGEGEASQDLVLGMRENIAGDLLRAATMLAEPFEVCRGAWNEVVRLGFRNLWDECWKARPYAQACLRTHRPDEGLAVLEPLIVALERGLEEELRRRSEAREQGEIPTKGELPPSYYRSMLASFLELRDKLEAERGGP